MDITVLGGAGEVGRLGMVLEEKGTRLLLDYGLAPTKPPKLPMHARDIDYALLSHAHVDHSGMIPRLAGLYSSSVTCTAISSNMTKLLLEDSLNISRKGDYPLPYNRGDFRATKRERPAEA